MDIEKHSNAVIALNKERIQPKFRETNFLILTNGMN